MITINDDEHQRALQYAAASLNYTWDRMNYGNLQNAAQRRFQHVYVGKAVEFATLRTLRAEEGLDLDPDPVATPHTDTPTGQIGFWPQTIAVPSRSI